MKALKIVFTTLLMIAISSPAFAAKRRTMESHSDSGMQQPKMYIGISGGQGTTDIPNVTTSSTVMSVFGGYSFNKNFAVELGYTKFGDLDVGSGVMFNGRSASLSLVPMLNLGQSTALFAKLGFGSNSFEATGSTSATTSTGPVFGAGIQFNMGKSMNLRLAYDNYRFDDSTPTTYNYKVANVAVMFRF